MASIKTAVFRPYARVMLLLGKELVKDDVLAVLELVKNSWDADADAVDVDIDTSGTGRIWVRDDGYGMSLEDIQTKWLAPATPSRLAQGDSEKPRTPNYNRVTLGEKGIGRFAVQHLGCGLRIVSRQDGSPQEVVLEVDWTRYEDPQLYLDEVENRLFTRKPTVFTEGRIGVLIEITGLYSQWKRESEDFYRLVNGLASIEDPFAENPKMSITLSLDGEEENLKESFIEDVRLEAAYLLSGSAGSDGLFKAVLKRKGLSSKDIEIDLKRGNPPLPLCGPFSVEFYVIERDTKEMRERFSKLSIPFGGIGLYRDWFRVLPSAADDSSDWLNIDLRRVHDVGGRLSTTQLFGRCLITRDDNPHLVDKTDREGLIDNDFLKFLKRSLVSIITAVEAQRALDRIAQKRRNPKPEVPNLLDELRKDKSIPVAVRKRLSTVAKTYAEEKANASNRAYMMMDLSGLGLAAERASHELSFLLRRVRDSLRDLTKVVANLPRVAEIVREIDSYCVELLKELAGLLPLYRSARRVITNVDMAKTCQNALFVFRRSFREDGIDAKVEVPDNFTIRESAGVILQVLINLLDNAVYWLDDLGHEDKRIRIVVDGRQRSLIIEDNGPGIEPGDLDALFEPFFSRKPNGRGLGLYIVKQQLDKRGYRIEVTEKGGLGGAQFRITFPTPEEE